MGRIWTISKKPQDAQVITQDISYDKEETAIEKNVIGYSISS